MKFFLFFFLITTSVFAQTGGHFVQRTQILMGDVPVSITIKTSQKKKAYQGMEEAFQEVRRIEKKVSEWQNSSETTLLNHHPLKWIPVGKDLMTILIQAQKISELTDGAFDISFASKNKNITYHDIDLWPEAGLVRLKKKNMKIGVSSIAKGYIVDRMAFILRKWHFHDFLINAGDMYAAGKWTVSIKGSDRPFILSNQAISTSALYERGDHIVDPRIGKTPHYYKSTTVIHPQSIISSPLATALFVMTPHESESFLRKHDFKAFIIER